MYKLVLCVIIVMSSTVLGFYYSNKLYKRKEILKLFVTNLKDAQTLIRYESKNLCDIFSDKFEGFEFCSENSFLPQWTELLNRYEKTLTKEDSGLLMSFAENAGKTDADGEISHIEMYVQLLNTCINDAENSIITKSKLYRTFGVSIGLIVSIMLL